MNRIRRILLPMDLRAGSQETFREAMDLARACGAKVHLLHAIPQGEEWSIPFDNAAMEAFDRFSDTLAANGEELVSRAFIIRAGRPADVILSAAHALEVDAIVLRGEDRTGWRRWLRSSVVDRIVRDSPCPVCVVPWSTSYGPPRDRAEQTALEDSLALQQLSLAMLAVGLLMRLWSGITGINPAASTWASAALCGVGVGVLVLAYRRLTSLRRRPGELREQTLEGQASRTDEDPDPILVPMLFGEGSVRALPLVRSLSVSTGSKALFFHAAPPGETWSPGTAASLAFDRFRDLIGTTAVRGVAAGFMIRVGAPAAELVRAVHDLHPCHLVLCADGGPSAPSSAVRRLLEGSPCPVWLVPTGAADVATSQRGVQHNA